VTIVYHLQNCLYFSTAVILKGNSIKLKVAAIGMKQKKIFCSFELPGGGEFVLIKELE